MTPSLLNITPELTASVCRQDQGAQSLARRHRRQLVDGCLCNSLGAEDMVLTDLIVKAKLPIEIFSLDTAACRSKPTT